MSSIAYRIQSAAFSLEALMRSDAVNREDLSAMARFEYLRDNLKLLAREAENDDRARKAFGPQEHGSRADIPGPDELPPHVRQVVDDAAYSPIAVRSIAEAAFGELLAAARPHCSSVNFNFIFRREGHPEHDG